LVPGRKQGIFEDSRQQSNNILTIKKGEKMPYVNIRVAGKLSKKQKEDICKGVTEVIAREAAKPPETILIFIDEVAHENIAKGGTLLQPPK
jgi:4-oxalocrotonate tautomerase